MRHVQRVQHLKPMILVGLSSQANLGRRVADSDVHNDGQMTVK
jgi:hypothetical protein